VPWNFTSTINKHINLDVNGTHGPGHNGGDLKHGAGAAAPAGAHHVGARSCPAPPPASPFPEETRRGAVEFSRSSYALPGTTLSHAGRNRTATCSVRLVALLPGDEIALSVGGGGGGRVGG
jgi:hypothetical protein